jgi:hypothetical protein
VGYLCPFCANEAELISTKNGAIISCSCGLSSKLFRTNGAADTWFHTRNGKAPDKLVVGVTAEKKATRPPQ